MQSKNYRLNRREARVTKVALAIFIHLTSGIESEPIVSLRKEAKKLWMNLTFHYNGYTNLQQNEQSRYGESSDTQLDLTLLLQA